MTLNWQESSERPDALFFAVDGGTVYHISRSPVGGVWGGGDLREFQTFSGPSEAKAFCESLAETRRVTS